MDPRPAPQVTVSDGTGRMLSGPRELLGEEPEPPLEGRRLDRRRLGGLALAAVAGFALATGLAELRTTTLEESDAGALSLDVRLEEDIRPGITVTEDDGRALTMVIALRNTGPRPVALESVELLGTPYRSEDLDGRRIASGAEVSVPLLRDIDCSRLGTTSTPGPLRVRATTSAGERSVDLRLLAYVTQPQDEQVRASCGQLEPDDALFVADGRDSLDGTTMVVDLVLRNGSSRALSVEQVIPARGVRIVGVTSADGTPLPLPLALPTGDFDPPVDAFLGGGPLRELSVRLAIANCSLFRPTDSFEGNAAVTIWVSGGRHGHPFGYELQEQWHEGVCGSDG